MQLTNKTQTQRNLQWNGPSETKPNSKNCKNCSSKCAYVHNFSTQYNTEQLISLLTSRQTS